MANTYFNFKTFSIEQKNCAMKVTTDACLFGAWVANQLSVPTQILDIGAGTGLLSLMIAHKQTNAAITSIEIEPSCYEQLTENIRQSPFSSNIFAIHADIRNFATPLRFDTIVSNPPFYENQLKSTSTTINKARHDESLSLQQLFTVASNLLTKDGSVYLLLPFYRKEEALTLAKEAGLYAAKINQAKQSPNHLPFRVMIKFTRTEVPVHATEIIIVDQGGKYTTAFSSLLQPYYLHL